MRNDRNGLIEERAGLEPRRQAVQSRHDRIVAGEDEDKAEKRGEDESDDLVVGQARGENAEGNKYRAQQRRAEITGKDQTGVRVAERRSDLEALLQ